MKLLGAALLAAGMMIASAAPSQAANATVKVLNQSDWAIQHMFLSPAEEEAWGPDWLGESVLSKGDSLKLSNIPCGDYDVRVVDEDGDECIIAAVKLCGDNSQWKITNEELLACIGEE